MRGADAPTSSHSLQLTPSLKALMPADDTHLLCAHAGRGRCLCGYWQRRIGRHDFRAHSLCPSSHHHYEVFSLASDATDAGQGIDGLPYAQCVSPV